MEETVKVAPDLRDMIKKLPLAPFIIGGFWVLVLILGAFLEQPILQILSDSFMRFGIWGMFVLAMVPSIQSGTGPNFAIQVGIGSGLLAMVFTIEMGFTGMSFVYISAILALGISLILGFLYGQLMNTVKGSEMAISTYTGFAITFLLYFVWLVYPFVSPFLGWFIGEGLRPTIALAPIGADLVLDRLFQFTVFGITFRTGTLLVFGLTCVFVWLFFRTKTGISISAVGANPVFARAAGLNVNKSRVIANMLSTSLAAVGVVVYAQSFGFVQIYDFPMWMAFPAVAAILVGGATARRAKVIHAVIGVFLFQGLLTSVPPIFNSLLEGADMTDAVRMVIQNGIILYALTKMSGGVK